jgi:hypothetical protein
MSRIDNGGGREEANIKGKRKRNFNSTLLPPCLIFTDT